MKRYRFTVELNLQATTPEDAEESLVWALKVVNRMEPNRRAVLVEIHPLPRRRLETAP